MPDENKVARLGDAAPSQDEFKIYSSKPRVRFLSQAVQPPSQVYIEVQDVLAVQVASTLAGEAVRISYRILKPDGEIVKGQFRCATATQRVIASVTEPLPEGFLLSVSCSAALATERGQTFVRMFLTDPIFGNAQPSNMLMADYVTVAMAPAYPNGRTLSPVEGPGNTIGQPFGIFPFGLDFTFNCPVNTRWKIKTIHAVFVTSAVVGNRQVQLTVSYLGQAILRAGSSAPQPASTVYFYTWSNFGAYGFDGVSVIMDPLPLDLVLSNPSQVGSLTTGLDVGDRWAAVNVQLEEWLADV